MPVNRGSFTSDRLVILVDDTANVVEGTVKQCRTIITNTVNQVNDIKARIIASNLSATRKNEMNNVVRPSIKDEIQTLVNDIQTLVDSI